MNSSAAVFAAVTWAAAAGFPAAAEQLALPVDGLRILSVRTNLAEGIATCPGGLLVADRGSARVVRLSNAGDPIQAWGTFGRGDGRFLHPIDVALHAGRAFVLDRHARRVSSVGLEARVAPVVIDLAGPELRDPIAIDVGVDGKLLLLDAGTNTIEVFRESGEHVTTIGGFGTGVEGMSCPHDLVVAPDGTIYVADAGNRRIQRYVLASGTCRGPWGSFGEGPDQFIDPTGVAIGPGGDLLVADHYGHRLQVLDARTGREVVARRLVFPERVRYPARIAVKPDGRCVVSCPQLSMLVELECP